MSQYGQGGPAPAQRKPGSRTIRAGVILLVLSVVLGTALVAAAFLPLVSGGQPAVIDGSEVIEADSDDTVVLYRLTGTDSASALDCTVVGPGEERLELLPEVFSSTVTVNGTSYIAEARFEAQQDGRHVVSCPVADRFAVGPQISIVRTLLLGFVGIFGGIVSFLVGIVLLIIGLVLRSNGTRPPFQPPPHPGAGTYQPGPYQPGPYQGPYQGP